MQTIESPHVLVLTNPFMRESYVVFVNGRLCSHLTTCSRQVFVCRELGVVVKIGYQSEYEAEFWQMVPEDKRRHFAQLLAYGKTVGDGRPWTAMRFVEGRKPTYKDHSVHITNLFTSLGVSDCHEGNWLITDAGPVIVDYGIPFWEVKHVIDTRLQAV